MTNQHGGVRLQAEMSHIQIKTDDKHEQDDTKLTKRSQQTQ
jgi:hypothetical protein